MRFWNCSEGQITLGGNNINLFDPEELRRNISLVSQRTYLFAETIRENLILTKIVREERGKQANLPKRSRVSLFVLARQRIGTRHCDDSGPRH